MAGAAASCMRRSGDLAAAQTREADLRRAIAALDEEILDYRDSVDQLASLRTLQARETREQAGAALPLLVEARDPLVLADARPGAHTFLMSAFPRIPLGRTSMNTTRMENIP